ncbi:MAG: tRNA pseudouridine(38-40) synthase TruA [Candidatus Rokuibacteriota bacterium]
MADAGPLPVAAPPPAAAIAPLRTLRLTLAYDGAPFHGWQVQPDAPTVQGHVLAAARPLFGEDVRLVGASRTDAGVHALRQTASLSGRSALVPAVVVGALNAALPPEIRVLDAVDAEPGFDARRHAAGKRYLYLLDTGAVPSPLLRRWAWHVGAPLDLAAMRAALRVLRGRHDFAAFCAAAGRDAAPECRVRALHVLERRRRVAILVSADRFLHHMVRVIVGSAIEVGRGARPPGWLADVLASRDRTRAGPTAPAHGLTLVRVLYPR